MEKNGPFSLTFCQIVALMFPHRSVALDVWTIGWLSVRRLPAEPRTVVRRLPDKRKSDDRKGETGAHDLFPLDGGESRGSDFWLQPVADLRMFCPILP